MSFTIKKEDSLAVETQVKKRLNPDSTISFQMTSSVTPVRLCNSILPSAKWEQIIPLFSKYCQIKLFQCPKLKKEVWTVNSTLS